MIYLYSGTCGSGKTLHASYDICEYVKKDRKVITNIVVNFEQLSKVSKKSLETLKNQVLCVSNEELSPKFLMDYSNTELEKRKEHQCLLIIDEAGDIYNPRTWDAKDRMSWLKFFRVHRKYGFDVIMVSQNHKYIDSQIRGVIETEIKHRNIKYYKFFGLILSFIFHGMFITVEYWYPMKLRCSSSVMLLHKKKANIYDTFQVYDDGHSEEANTGQGIPVFTSGGTPAPVTAPSGNE